MTTKNKTNESNGPIGNYLFDGFCHREYDEKIDGWMNEQKLETRAVMLAREIIDQHAEINKLRRENWKLRKDINQLRELSHFFG